MMGYSHLSANPSKTFINDQGENNNFIMEESGREPLNPVSEDNISCNGTNWYQMTSIQQDTSLL